MGYRIIFGINQTAGGTGEAVKAGWTEQSTKTREVKHKKRAATNYKRAIRQTDGRYCQIKPCYTYVGPQHHATCPNTLI